MEKEEGSKKGWVEWILSKYMAYLSKCPYAIYVVVQWIYANNTAPEEIDDKISNTQYFTASVKYNMLREKN